MPPETPPPGSAQDWLRYAASDMELARSSGIPNVMLESLCCHAQQCAEKAMKGLLVACHIPIRKTHSIGLLLDMLSEHVPIPRDLEQAAILTDYAVASRYPGDVEPITQSEYEQAVHLAEGILTWSRQIVDSL